MRRMRMRMIRPWAPRWAWVMLTAAVAVQATSENFARADASPDSSATAATATTTTFHFQTILETATSLHRWSDPDHSALGRLWLAPSLELNPEWNLSSLWILSRGFTQYDEVQLVKGDLTLRRAPMPINPTFQISPAATAILPLTSETIQRDSLYGGAKLAARLIPTLPLANLTAFYDLSVSKYFHQYRTKTDGRSNTSFALTHWLTLGYSLAKDLRWAKQIGLSTAFIFSNGWSYGGNNVATFEIAEELSFDLSNHFTVTLGHTNSGNALRANGMDSNITLFDKRSSVIYGLVGVSI